MFQKSRTGTSCIAYEDSVREALCFGWIDSLIKRLDNDRFARKFTPRQPTSKWSELNRQRWAELKATGLLAAPGLEVAPTENTYVRRREFPELPSYIGNAFKRSPKAWTFFESLAPTYRRHFVLWIDSAKRPETREKRLQESIELLARGQKLGLK